MTLRLVHPTPKLPQKTKHSRHENDVFTTEQQARLRCALGNVRRAYGGRRRLAAAIGCSQPALYCAEKGPGGFSAALAIRLARLTGLSLDAILRPGLYVAGPCPTCGRSRQP